MLTPAPVVTDTGTAAAGTAIALTNMVAPAILRADLIQRLKQWASDAEAGYSPRTIECFRGTMKVVGGWCLEHGHDFIPASPDAVIAFLDAHWTKRKHASLKRYLADWSTLHQAAGVPSPMHDKRVQLRLKAHGNRQGRQQKQAPALGKDGVAAITSAPRVATPSRQGYRPEIAALAELRDKLLLNLLNNSMIRTFEVQHLRWEDITAHPNGTGTIRVPVTKGHYSDGRTQFLTRTTMALLAAWQGAIMAHIATAQEPVADNGFIFWVLSPKLVNRISRNAVSAAVKRGGLALGTDKYSGHSTRVGTACDIVRSGGGVAEATQAGGWKRPDQVISYARNEIAAQGAVARLHAHEGETKPRLRVPARRKALAVAD